MKHPSRSDTVARGWHRMRQGMRHAGRRICALWKKLSFARRKQPSGRSLDWTEERREKRLPLISPARGFLWYIVLFVAALLFTQILRSRASNLFFWFVLLLLPALLLYTLTARLTLGVYLATEHASIEKLQPCPYELRIINSGIFAYPFVDAVVRIPRQDAVRTGRRKIRMSLPALSTYSIANEVTFRFRGTYEIGVSCFYVYDFFRILRVRVDVDDYREVLVLPRKRMLDGEGAPAVSDTAKQVTRSPYAFDRLEMLDVRDYRPGDALKDVHWKLSSKTEELLVRDYSSGSSNKTIIYCDLSACYPVHPPEKEKAMALSRKQQRRAAREAKRRALEEQERARRNKRLSRTEQPEGWTADGKRDADLATVATDDPNIRSLADEDILRKSRERSRAVGGMKRQRHAATELIADEGTFTSATERADPHALADDTYYADMNEFCADGVVELAISIVLRELRSGNSCMLMWFDARAELGAFGFELTEERDFDAIYHLFSTAPLCTPTDHHVGKLRAMLGDTQGVKQVFVSAALDAASMSALCELPGMSGGAEFGAAELVYYNPEERFANIAERRRYLDSCRDMLSANGILMVDGSARFAAVEKHKQKEGRP